MIHRCLNHPQKSERHLEKSEHFKVMREVNKGEKYRNWDRNSADIRRTEQNFRRQQRKLKGISMEVGRV